MTITSNNTILIILAIFLLNVVASFVTVFWSKRDVAAIWAWLLVLVGLPFIGLGIFWFFGRRISDRRIFDFTSQERITREQNNLNQSKRKKEFAQLTSDQQQLVELFATTDNSALTTSNKVDFFYRGQDLFESLEKDIKNAKSSIHLEFFTIYPDKLGQQIVNLLAQKAKEGVEVRVIYDQFGSKGRNKKLYRQLIKNGGIVYPFLMRRFQPLSLHINFRLHRKVGIIDGKVGYIGGFNIGDQYLGSRKRFGFWRDTHLRMTGDSVMSLQSRFITDWNATADKKTQVPLAEYLFPVSTNTNGVLAQIVSSGPDTQEQQIKEGYVKMFSSAKKSIHIQTPYFIPDPVVFQTLAIAIKSGVKVYLMIPNKPDHMFVYRATEYYAQELLDLGAEVYIYDEGFLHVKSVIIDGEVSTVGSANMDIRSFDLNFEANAVLYSKKMAKELTNQFNEDVKHSVRLTKEYFEKQGFWMSFIQKFSRLLSPLL